MKNSTIKIAIDSGQLDILIIDEKTNTLKRPWLNIAVDLDSRLVLGMCLSSDRDRANLEAFIRSLKEV